MIKSVFFDIDGTLVSLKTKQCAQSAKEAIQALRAGGVRVYVATGRSKIEMDSENMLADVAFDGYLCNNGQVIYDGAWRCLHATVMNRNDVAAIVDYAERAGLPLWMVGDAGSFISRYDSRVFQVMEAIHTAPPPLGDLREMLDKPIYKAVFFMTAQEAREGPLAVAPHCKRTEWYPLGQDLIPDNGGKLPAMREVMRRLGISQVETMAFGDSENDIEMLSYAGIGVAMGNATEETKAVADYVTTDCDEDGIWNALKHFQLI